MNRLAALALLALAGCATAETPEQQTSRLVGDWRNACIAQGMTSPEQQDACITVMAQTYANEQANRQQAYQALAVMGMAMQANAAARPVTPLRPMTTCQQLGTQRQTFVQCY